MSNIADLPIRVCNRCGAVWMEDDRMYEEVDRCPHCGVVAGEAEYEGKREEIEF